MKKAHKKVWAVLIAVVLAAATHALWLPLPAQFLAPADNVKKADAIAVLSGDWLAQREDKAVELYKQRLAPRIIKILEEENRPLIFAKKVLNQNIAQKDAYTAFFESRGVQPADIIIGGETATSTFDELKAVKDIALKNNFRSIILVTGDYHMRRALMTARWIFGHSGVKIYNASAHSKGFSPRQWWRREDDIKGVVLEYLSIMFYLTYHFTLGR
ncbi:MAG: YdcF family protein [Candidatus Omnitrophica bacterium]|nr:YdcF family protein [Candidatus Omnitrophota bacterium]